MYAPEFTTKRTEIQIFQFFEKIRDSASDGVTDATVIDTVITEYSTISRMRQILRQYAHNNSSVKHMHHILRKNAEKIFFKFFFGLKFKI